MARLRACAVSVAEMAVLAHAMVVIALCLSERSEHMIVRAIARTVAEEGRS